MVSDNFQPTLDDIDQEDYIELKTSHDLFRTESNSYTDGNGDLKSCKVYVPNFLDKLVVRRVPCMVDEVKVLDELVLQAESETNKRIKQLVGYEKCHSDTFSTKSWRKTDRRSKRQRDKRVCRNYDNFDDGLGDNYNFSDNRKDMWWWIY